MEPRRARQTAGFGWMNLGKSHLRKAGALEESHRLLPTNATILVEIRSPEV
jgi:hypothetical protein